jgi:SAM-dependent methyltransferase
MDFVAIEEAFRTLQSDPALRLKSNLHTRAEALDTLSFIEEVIQHNPKVHHLAIITEQVHHLRDHLELINTQVFNETREILKSPNRSKQSIRRLLNSYTNYQPGKTGHVHVDYESLDVLISGTLFPHRVPNPQMELTPDMVHWEASPGSVILDLLDHVLLRQRDVFFDLGSGLGSVSLLVNLLSGVRVVGIEREPVYCQYAQQLASEYALENVLFINCDARDADLNSGTVFYLFTPFMQSILDDVMQKIHHVAQQHPIRVCSFGPCTPEIARLTWLTNISGDTEHEFKLAIFKSRPEYNLA